MYNDAQFVLEHKKQIKPYPFFFYQPRKILEAREVNCAKDPLNRDDGALLPKKYLHLTLANKKKMTHILNFNQRLVYICAFVWISLSLPLKKVRDCDRNVGNSFIVNNFRNAFNHQCNLICIFNCF